MLFGNDITLFDDDDVNDDGLKSFRREFCATRKPSSRRRFGGGFLTTSTLEGPSFVFSKGERETMMMQSSDGAPPSQSGAGEQRLKSSRQRHIAQALRKVDDAGRDAATRARLDALERDALPDDDEANNGGDDDEEFVVEEPELDGGDDENRREEKDVVEERRERKSDARSTRVEQRRAASAKTMRTFNQLLEANALDEAPVGIPTYTTIAAGPPSSVRASKVLLGVRVPVRTRVLDAGCGFAVGSAIRFTRRRGV